MTTGRINQVTILQETNKSERKKMRPFFFCCPSQILFPFGNKNVALFDEFFSGIRKIPGTKKKHTKGVFFVRTYIVLRSRKSRKSILFTNATSFLPVCFEWFILFRNQVQIRSRSEIYNLIQVQSEKQANKTTFQKKQPVRKKFRKTVISFFRCTFHVPLTFS